ncbi:MAG: signal peptidase I [Armatimonadetes bacterium]|nr:signal peptidase I [Armatimonadota bacterium]MBS1700407.1 signal peptidase I [Armatimonadota bacterium]MBS1725331.1 signal peptidase I [Armatimonadota bacterium]
MEAVVESQNPPKPKTKVRGFTIFLIVVLMVSIVFFTSFKTAEVRGESMLPTLQNGQKVLTCHAYWLVGQIKVNDIIVLKEEKSNDYFIKRVLGLPGDAIPWSMAPRDWPLEKGNYIVPPGRIYVVGDNINHSDDSRKFGAFLQSNILGKVITWR